MMNHSNHSSGTSHWEVSKLGGRLPEKTPKNMKTIRNRSPYKYVTVEQIVTTGGV